MGGMLPPRMGHIIRKSERLIWKMDEHQVKKDRDRERKKLTSLIQNLFRQAF